MGGDDKDGYYCSVCGGIPPDKITTKRVLIDGKETGIDHLDWIFDEVTRLRINDDALLTTEIMKRVQEFNYVPTKKSGVVRNSAPCRIQKTTILIIAFRIRYSHSGSLRYLSWIHGDFAVGFME